MAEVIGTDPSRQPWVPTGSHVGPRVGGWWPGWGTWLLRWIPCLARGRPRGLSPVPDHTSVRPRSRPLTHTPMHTGVLVLVVTRARTHRPVPGSATLGSYSGPSKAAYRQVGRRGESACRSDGGGPRHPPVQGRVLSTARARPRGGITPRFLSDSGPELSCFSLGPRRN